MIERRQRLLRATVAAFGEGWTRFWFTPSDPATLSAIRVLIGLVAVYLHGTLLFDLVTFFGPNGLLPVRRHCAARRRHVLVSELPLDAAPNCGRYICSDWRCCWSFTLGFWTRFTSVLSLVVFLVGRASGADDHGPHRTDRRHAAGLFVPGALRSAIFARPLAGDVAVRPAGADAAACRRPRRSPRG